MNRTLFRTLTWLMWLAVPAMALRFSGAWDQLPAARMATHFNAAGQPNGWMPREQAFTFSVGVIAFMLVVFTVILWLMRKQQTAGAVSWAMLAFSYLMIGFVYAANEKVLTYNLTGKPVDFDLWPVLIPPAVIALIAIYLQSTRGMPLPSGAPLAAEVHNSPLWGAVLIFAGAGAVIAGMQAPTPVRIGTALICLIMLISGLAAWSGFRYSFTQSGLEISALGYRLRSISQDQIKSYSIEPWNAFRGYGIRGVGNLRAYVWGNRGVMIDTTQGKVFLGCNDPEQIVRDLDMIAPRGAPVGPL